jgi:hypothetical protein
VSAKPLPLAGAAERLRGKPGRPRKTPAVAVAPVQAITARLVDVAGAAAYLACSSWTVRDMLAASVLRPVRLTTTGGRDLRRILVDVRDLDALIERSKESA